MHTGFPISENVYCRSYYDLYLFKGMSSQLFVNHAHLIATTKLLSNKRVGRKNNINKMLIG
jgi:hypothetical protein